MCGWDGGEKESYGDWVMGPKVGQLTLSMGPARGEVHSYIMYKEVHLYIRQL